MDCRNQGFDCAYMESDEINFTSVQFDHSHPSKDPKKSPYGQLLDNLKLSCTINSIAWRDDLQRDLPKKWEKHGNMILLPENSFQRPEWRTLGPSLWSLVASALQCERLGRKRRIYDDAHRSPHVELLFGSDGWVQHIDNGIKYNYDVTKCMFSIGNISEKLRIASFDCKYETVVDLFAGIGYFTLPYIIHAKASHVFACEWNPDAVEALRCNLADNKVEQFCTILEGDCRKVCPVRVADRVNLGLLPTASSYWMTACRALKPSGGYLHIHENITLSKLHKTFSCDTTGVLLKTRNIAKNDAENMVDINENSLARTFTSNLEKQSSLPDDTAWNADTAKENEESYDLEKPIKRKLSQQIAEQTKPTDPESYVMSVNSDFEEKWLQLDEAYRQFSLSAARRIFAFLNNMHYQKFTVRINRIGKIKSYAPRIDHVVLDLECRPVDYENRELT